MALLIIPVLKRWSRARGPYGYLRTWNWPITAREISQPCNNSIYKLGDIGISSNLIGSLSLTNGHCPPPGRWIMKQWPAGVNSCFAEVTENDILRMQDLTIPNDTKKATKFGIMMIVFRDKQCFNTQFAHMSSVFCPDRQASPMPLSSNNNCPSILHFKFHPG